MGFLDALIVVPLVVFYLLFKYYTTDHQTAVDKDRVRFNKGISLYEQGDCAEALAYFDQQVKEHPKSALAYAYRGRCHQQEDNLHTALYNFNHALSFELNLPDVLVEKGKIHYQLEEFKEAYLAFDKAAWFTRNKYMEALEWRTKAKERLSKQDNLNLSL